MPRPRKSITGFRLVGNTMITSKAEGGICDLWVGRPIVMSSGSLSSWGLICGYVVVVIFLGNAGLGDRDTNCLVWLPIF